MNQTSETDDAAIQYLSSLLGINVYKASFTNVREEVAGAGQHVRTELLNYCRSFDASALCNDRPLRVTVVRVMSSLLPKSIDLLSRWLVIHDDTCCYELQFTTFCYIDWIGTLPNTRNYKYSVLDIVKQYLIHVKTSKASAAWMAGHLLGKHWPTVESLPILIAASRHAKYVAGRKASLFGLRDILDLTEQSYDVKKSVVECLNEVIAMDTSKYVRRNAGYIREEYLVRLKERGSDAPV